MTVCESIRSTLSYTRGLLRRAQFIAPLLARASVGVAFAESGWGKLHDLEAVAAYFAELGIPAPRIQAGFVSYVELICGCLVLLGLMARLAALPLIGTMVVALLTARANDVAGFSDLIGTIELCYALLLTWIVLAGPGGFSLDHAITRRSRAAVPGPDPRSAPLCRALGIRGARARLLTNQNR